MNNIILNVPKGAMKNRNQIEQSQNCGCFHCLSIFPANSITQWTDQNKTGICPNCNVDSVLPDSEFPISLDFLQQTQNYWFNLKK